jgi:hypothetical protein
MALALRADGPLRNTFNGGSVSYHNTLAGLNPGAVDVADWSNGVQLVAENTSSFAAPVIGLNFFPPSSTVASNFWQSNTDAPC